MAKIDYEGAWEKLKEKYGEKYIIYEGKDDVIDIMGEEYILYEGGEDVGDVMKELEQKYTQKRDKA